MKKVTVQDLIEYHRELDRKSVRMESVTKGGILEQEFEAARTKEWLAAILAEKNEQRTKESEPMSKWRRFEIVRRWA
jgi:hypothetical protein